jgi:hypothetical protein
MRAKVLTEKCLAMFVAFIMGTIEAKRVVPITENPLPTRIQFLIESEEPVLIPSKTLKQLLILTMP